MLYSIECIDGFASAHERGPRDVRDKGKPSPRIVCTGCNASRDSRQRLRARQLSLLLCDISLPGLHINLLGDSRDRTISASSPREPLKRYRGTEGSNQELHLISTLAVGRQESAEVRTLESRADPNTRPSLLSLPLTSALYHVPPPFSAVARRSCSSLASARLGLPLPLLGEQVGPRPAAEQPSRFPSRCWRIQPGR